VDLASSSVVHNGSPTVLVNIYDITGRKKSERAHRELRKVAQKQEDQLVHSTRLAELGAMAASVAHELNQPLTGIKNFAKNAVFMLENDVGDPDDVPENLRQISKQVDRASRIINRMRQLTRKEEHELKPLDVNNVVRENLEFLGPQMRLSGVLVEFESAEDLPKTLGDHVRLEQVFLNLLTNARQAMESSRERRLRVRTVHESESAYPVVVEIADTGVGFDKEQRRQLFAPFFSTKKAGHGTGLGLSISLSIIKEHHGTIDAEGEPGKGATFTVRLPRFVETESGKETTGDG